MTRILTVAEMTMREVARRRVVLALLLLLPLAFYLVRRDEAVGQSVRSLFIGVSWAVSTAALFVTTANRNIEPRLRMAGYRSHHLWAGRLAGLWALGIALAAPFQVLVLADAPKVRHGAIAIAMLCCVAVAAPLGMLIGMLLPRELEGTLLLLTIVALQMTIDPAGTVARFTPLWSTRELGTYAVDLTSRDYLERGLAHGLAATALLVVAVAVACAVRLRQRGHLRHVNV